MELISQFSYLMEMNSISQIRKCKIPKSSQIIISILLFCNFVTKLSEAAACDKSRKIFNGISYGEISHGLNANYTQDSHCEWLIKAVNDSQFITLNFLSLKTECSYDYIFVYDGNSYNSRLIGSFSGQTDPEDVTAFSGFMLLLLYSDTNYVLDGFRAQFSITNCLNNCSNHGLCLNHSCLCRGDWFGQDCSVKACDCGDDENRGFCSKDRCECRNGFSGQSCSLHKHNPLQSQWHWLTNSTYSFSKRAAHTAVYHEGSDSVYVFGGYDLNDVLGSLEIFRFNSSIWEDDEGLPIQLTYEDESRDKSVLKDILLDEHPESKRNLGVLDQFWFRAALLSHVQTPSASPANLFVNISASRNTTKPDPRYGHAACIIGNSFVLYGGKLANGNLSNELWLYNILTREWSLRAGHSDLTPPELARHTLTYVKSNENIYLFGGALNNGEFSSRMFRIKLSKSATDDQWEEVFARGGKSFDYRIVAHTTNYHQESDSLFVYGGILASVARLSKLSDRIFSFNIADKHWTEIFYPKTILREMSIPRERAFHTATIAGDYLIVFGGYSHRHNKEEICYDNQMYLYHLGCHAWINQEALGANRANYPKKQGVFAQAAVLRGNNTLLIIGGYHGNVNNDFLAFTLPDMMVPSKNLTESEKCTEYKSSTECIANPQCGWCSSDASCYGRTMSNCFTNLQTTRCPGVCSALRDCQSCLVHGSSDSSSVNKLPVGKCSWCVQNTKCHRKNDYEPCGESDSVEKIGYQWWGRSGVEVEEKNQCTKLDKPPGLIYSKYFYPFDWNMPDYVSLVNSTLVDFIGTSLTPHVDSSQNGEVIARLRGFLHLPTPEENQKEILKVCASYAQIELKVSSGNDMTVVSNFSTDQNHCVNTLFKWDEQRFLIDLQAKRKLTNQISQLHYQSKVGLQNNATKAFTFEFLEPFSNGSCNQYDNCLYCLSDNGCGWCDLKNQCVSRDVNETSECTVGDHWRYLILQPSQCVNCSNLISCDACTKSLHCEWWTEETKCVRAGRSSTGIKDSRECPSPCYLRTNCTSCLDEKGRCVWCENQRKCFSFSVYISEYQFGLCREWVDQPVPMLDPVKSIEHHQCKSCSALTNCSSCLKSLNCGWCFFQNSPIQGACVKGDFNSSSVECGIVLNSTEPTRYNYESCPDVDECALNIDDCHINAQCSNTNGSFFCKCMKGFVGDGKHKCDKTCIETCHHGRCSNYPEFTCLCNLGWTGVDCSLNCGCNNHSTCKNGLSICDECQDFTEGLSCEKCVTGSYGNSTTTGCIPCNCNGHGDEKLGQCDQDTGQCFCLDNTEGKNCDLCAKDYYGEPRNGGQCYLQCQSRSVLKTLRTQGIGSYRTLDGTRECLWILKLDESIIEGSLIHLQIKEREMNVSCYNNAIYIYNNIPEFSKSMMQKKLSSVVCSDSSFPKIEESKTGQMTVYFRKSQNNEGFNAVISVLSCHLGTCVEPYICNTTKHCVCPPGFGGLKCEIEACPFNCTIGLQQGSCDTTNNRCDCNDGFGGEDCSRTVRSSSIVISELFNTQIVTDRLSHLKKTLPRFGHTVNADRRGFLWIFGGYSLANGALNDIRQFDTKNHTWMQVTVDGSDAKMPVGRYFHASEVSKQSIFTYGGLKNDVQLLNDFWMFNIQEQRWMEIEADNKNVRPGFLSGHSLTLVKIGDRESLFLIGGYSNETASTTFSPVWEYSFDQNWNRLNTTGAGPVVIFGHSTVYHASSEVLYVFGGYQIVEGKLQNSKKLYSLSFQKENNNWSWSVLPVFSELNRPEENLPRSRSFHSAVSYPQYMILYGESQPFNSSDYLNAYVYKCNSWIRLTESVEIIGKPTEKLRFAQAVSIESDPGLNNFYLVGGLDSSFSISKITIPSDICQLWSFSKYLCRLVRGCSFGTITTNSTKNTFCFSSVQKESRVLEVSSAFNHGLVCDDELLAQRNCSSFNTCSDCESVWPSEKQTSCRWCKDDSCNKFKKCTSNALKNNETLIPIESCPNVNCSSVDCENCLSKPGCNWTRHNEMFSCLAVETVQTENLEVLNECPQKCSSFIDCDSCLSSVTFEGGYSNCEWSTKLNRCLSPSYKSLICSGARCGLLLTKNDSNQCPLSCESYTMCSKCLQNAHCGWCSTENEESGSGDGICIEGSLDRPVEDGEENEAVCKVKYELNKNVTVDSTFAWNFLSCPPENECSNYHHTCDNKTEQCVDLQYGFRCECAHGYKKAERTNDCLPICLQGCIRGDCLEPGVCKCNFGYVGDNCSIPCLCSGHSDCVGVDKLDVCLECKNNTIGKQCEKCDKFFVGDPKNNGKCVSCLEYCNGHTDTCVAESNDGYTNLTRSELEAILTEGARLDAICLNCANQTDGSRCETCTTGYFRGTTNLNEGCRKCQCNGHGDTCDPATGEKCNCGNNSENDNTCPAKLDKNSVYHCWSGCSKCKDSFSGHPKNSHQCYKHITIDSKMCLDAKPLDECKNAEPLPLQGGKTVFFVVQPRFMNVDIRIILDVTEGDVDFFMSSNDDSFVVLTNHSNGIHEVLLDSKYQWIQEVDTEFEYTENLNITPLMISSKKSFENVSVPYGFNDDRGASDCRSNGKFHVMDKVAQSLSTHITLSRCNTLLRVFGLKNRLVVTLPQNVHNLSGTRFFIALRAANHAEVTGLLFFRQDQLHIDLFVFFSVFFSCFFLFLSACVVFWKVKQAADLRRARRRHVVEMLHMAQRPYSPVILDTTLENPPELQSLKSGSRNKSSLSRKGNIAPVAIETTADGLAAVCTIFVRLPGHKRSPLCLGSALIVQPKNNIFLNKPPPRISQQVV